MCPDFYGPPKLTIFICCMHDIRWIKKKDEVAFAHVEIQFQLKKYSGKHGGMSIWQGEIGFQCLALCAAYSEDSRPINREALNKFFCLGLQTPQPALQNFPSLPQFCAIPLWHFPTNAALIFCSGADNPVGVYCCSYNNCCLHFSVLRCSNGTVNIHVTQFFNMN